MVQFAWQFFTDEISPTPIFDTTQIPTAANGFSAGNDKFWSNADADKYGRDTDTFIGHSPERMQSYLQQQIVVSKELPQIPMFGIPALYITSNGMQNLRASAGGQLEDPQEWYLGK